MRGQHQSVMLVFEECDFKSSDMNNCNGMSSININAACDDTEIHPYVQLCVNEFFSNRSEALKTKGEITIKLSHSCYIGALQFEV